MVTNYKKHYFLSCMFCTLFCISLVNPIISQNLDFFKISDVSAFDYRDFKVAPNGNYWVLMSDNKIYTSSDKGTNWTFDYEFDVEIDLINIFSDNQLMASADGIHYVRQGTNSWNVKQALNTQQFIYFKDDIIYTETNGDIFSSEDRGETTTFLINSPPNFIIKSIRISDNKLILLNQDPGVWNDLSNEVLIINRNTFQTIDTYTPGWGEQIKFIEILDDERIVFNVVSDLTATDGPYYEDVYITNNSFAFGESVISSRNDGSRFYGMTIFNEKILVSMPSCTIAEYDFVNDEKKTHQNFPYGSLYSSSNELFVLNEYILNIENLELGVFTEKSNQLKVETVIPVSYGGKSYQVAGNSNIYYPLDGRLFESKDFGETWKDLKVNNEKIVDWKLSPKGDLYVYTYCNIYYKRFDNGEFEVFPHELYRAFNSSSQSNVRFVGFGKVTNSFIALVGNVGWPFPSVYKISYDNGKTWTDCADQCFNFDFYYENETNTFKIVDNRLVTLNDDEVFDVANSPFDFLQYEMFIISDQEIHFIPQEGTGPSYITRDFGITFQQLSDSPAGKLVKGPDFESTFILEENFNTLYYRENADAIYKVIDISFLPNINEIHSDNKDHVYLSRGNRSIFRLGSNIFHKQIVKGSIYFDENQNCTFDGDDYVSDVSWTINLKGNGLNLTSYLFDGQYTFNVPMGDYTISVFNNSPRWSFCDEERLVSVNSVGEEVSSSFFVYADEICSDISLSVSSFRLRACAITDYNIRVINTGTSDTDDTQIEVTLDEQFEFIESNVPSTLLADNKLLLDIGSLKILGAKNVQVRVVLSCDAELGAEHCFRAKVIDDNLCSDVIETVFSEYQVNVGPFDPNDMRVFDDSGTRSYQFDKSDYQYYHVRFQNTGTDTAYNVVLLNYMDPKLDLSSLEILNSSHSYIAELSGEHNLLIKFDNIYLPDSFVNEAASNGYIKFKVKPIVEIEYGDVLQSECDIFFDINAPVRTNIAEVLIDNSVCNERIRYSTISSAICESENLYGFEEVGFHQLMFKANDGCDSLLNIVIEKVNEEYFNNDRVSICEGDEYNGLIRDTFYRDDLTSINGCDSVEILRLKILSFNNPIENLIYLLPGDTIEGYFEPGIFIDTTIGFRCQEIINTVAYKTINENYEYVELCFNETYQGYFQSGIYIDTLDQGPVCNIRTLELLIQEELETYLDVLICEGDSYSNYTQTGSYEDYMLSQEGCDSIVYLNLTVVEDEFVNINEVVCAGQTYESYSSTGIYIDTFANIRGCDSIRILELLFEDVITSEVEIELCNGESFDGYSATGEYQDVYETDSGCDSIRNLTLNIIDVVEGSEFIEICHGEEYLSFNESGNYNIVSETENGCDSITQLSLSVLDEITFYIQKEVCDGTSVDGYSSSGQYEDTFVASNGCDSIRTLELTILDQLYFSVDTILCSGQFIDGMRLNSGDQIVYPSIDGCDSIVTFNISYDQTYSICSENRTKVFPNPTYDRITVVEELGNEVSFINVYDGLGHFVGRQNLEYGLTFSIKNYPAGIYLLRIETIAGRIEVHKVIKL